MPAYRYTYYKTFYNLSFKNYICMHMYICILNIHIYFSWPEKHFTSGIYQNVKKFYFSFFSDFTINVFISKINGVGKCVFICKKSFCYILLPYYITRCPSLVIQFLVSIYISVCIVLYSHEDIYVLQVHSNTHRYCSSKF